MNGRYMGWREQRWVERDAERLERMRERKEKKREAEKEGKDNADD